MENDREWTVSRRGDHMDMKSAGIGLIRFCMLFGAFALVLAVLIVPAIDRKANGWGVAGRTDPMSVASTGGGGSYVVHRNVLQATPNAICITRANGSRSGDC